MGGDVATAITALIGNEKAFGETYNITGCDHMIWEDVLNIYTSSLESKLGIHPLIYKPCDSNEIANLLQNHAQIFYDRLYDRMFDNTKIMNLIGNRFQFISMKKGLTKCINNFLESPTWRGSIDVRVQAFLDKKMGTKKCINELPNAYTKIKYLGWYCVPSMLNVKNRVLRQYDSTISSKRKP